MTLQLPRRSFLLGLGSALAAPAIVRASSLMPVSAPKLVVPEPLAGSYNTAFGFETYNMAFGFRAFRYQAYGEVVGIDALLPSWDN